ncbi:hypothetical protein BGZ47_005762, partial [Haplosporangium gracile]
MIIKPKNPLDLPELRALVATYFDRKDLVVCLRVSRDWLKDFVGPVWYTIDFVKEKEFVDLPARFSPSMAVQSVEYSTSALSWASDSIKDQNGNYLEAGTLTTCLTLSLDSSTIGSRLTSLSLNRICFSHEGFTKLLQNSSNLHKLSLSKSYTFSAKNISNSMVLSLISHNTLTAVIIIDQCTDATAMRRVYLIPKSCLHLEVLVMRALVLDMAVVKEHKWSCQDLRELHVQFKGLENAQAIDECLKIVFSRRSRSSTYNTVNKGWMQIFDHLCQFDKLRTVSLGTKIYYLPLSCEGCSD